jgi:hypothetical protein
MVLALALALVRRQPLYPLVMRQGYYPVRAGLQLSRQQCRRRSQVLGLLPQAPDSRWPWLLLRPRLLRVCSHLLLVRPCYLYWLLQHLLKGSSILVSLIPYRQAGVAIASDRL